MPNREGFTLLELTIVLTIATIILLIAVPSLARGRDTLAVRSARAELASAIAVARSTAIVNGGAQVIIDTAIGVVTVATPDGVGIGAAIPLRTLYGVSVQSDRGVRVALRFDALGIGRLTNVSLRVSRGSQMALLTVSAYGRVRL
jgi:prepilin-type N-terminal cleavage/methylation domain-containing protein